MPSNHLEVPHQSAQSAPQTPSAQAVGDLVGPHAVVEGGDLEPELLGEVEHDRHLVARQWLCTRMSPLIAPASESS